MGCQEKSNTPPEVLHNNRDKGLIFVHCWKGKVLQQTKKFSLPDLQ